MYKHIEEKWMIKENSVQRKRHADFDVSHRCRSIYHNGPFWRVSVLLTLPALGYFFSRNHSDWNTESWYCFNIYLARTGFSDQLIQLVILLSMSVWDNFSNFKGCNLSINSSCEDQRRSSSSSYITHTYIKIFLYDYTHICQYTHTCSHISGSEGGNSENDW